MDLEKIKTKLIANWFSLDPDLYGWETPWLKPPINNAFSEKLSDEDKPILSSYNQKMKTAIKINIVQDKIYFYIHYKNEPSEDRPQDFILKDVILQPVENINSINVFIESEFKKLNKQHKLVLSESQIAIQSLRKAIRNHRDEKGHDRCWLDDQTLYNSLPEGLNGINQTLPSEKEFLTNCKKYFEYRKSPNNPTLTFVRQNEIPTLIPLDMSKAKEHNHPDIDIKKTYLCLINNQYFAGKFSKEWYGLSFNGGINPVGLQFDAPGWNFSKWKKIWEINE
jgi:hypothetical protein